LWAFATDDDLGGPPMKVAKLKKHDFARAQPQSGEEEQDGRIAPTADGGAIRRGQHALHFLG
jgi:hypothetical protein